MDEKKLLNAIDKKFDSQAQLINTGFQMITDELQVFKNETRDNFSQVDERFESLRTDNKYQADKMYDEIADLKDKLGSINLRTDEESTDIYKRVDILEKKLDKFIKAHA